MIKKVVNFFDSHRLFLVLLILLVVVILFLSINSYLFLHHEFKALDCTEEIDEEYCYHNDTKILKNPEESAYAFFEKYHKGIDELIEKYNLDEFNNYTAYYYLVASRLHYETNEEYKILVEFFEAYTNTYNMEKFYFDNTIYFNMFYPYKIN